MISFNKEQFFIVTGASSGIGEGIALLLNKLGASVIAIGRDELRLTQMQQKSQYPENIFLETKNLSENIEQLPEYIKSLKNKYTKFQGLVYCAGITKTEPLQLTQYEEALKLFNINYFAPVMMAKGMADRRNNAGKGTAMVFISSVAAMAAPRGLGIYSGSKAAISSTIKSIARELASHNIRANCISPSDIVTPMTLADPDVLYSKQYPMGYGEVSDVANLAVFLLAKESKWITGQNYIVDCAYF